ncbi:beta-lactamase family protein [Flavihumibacter rivuli]|uniref:serine hydrolase domain-containing protein n=1 Tax=Flavihumibacter rivuli TaxID=2838156 RepID=UPI001BDE20FD|nr:serine hydrolase domain-containing protein [Flavihumibacter rivuli]ULQ57614.1 beta-lactamase family protein [Flavihumibacter rivuli]
MKNKFVQILVTGILVASLPACKQRPDNDAARAKGTGAPTIASTLHFADEHTTATYETAINKFFKNGLFRSGFNGSYLVAKEGKIIAEGYNGFLDPVTKTDSIGEHDAFHLASVSKTFTGMAVLKLWEEGKIGLDDDLSKYFDKFPYPGTTVKMLLSHRSGLPNYTNYLEHYNWDKKKLVTNLDVLTSLYTMHPPLQFPTGKRFSYCNTNYALLALLIEKVSGKAYHVYLEETFFKPLGMTDTYVFSLDKAETAMPSFEWNNRRYGLEFMDLVYGDKNIYSTVRDMLKWDEGLRNGNLFRQSTLDSAFQGYSYEKAGARNYGLGWRLTEVENGKKIVYHNGWWHGNNTVFIRLLEEKATIIVLGNKYNRGIYRSKQLCDIFGDYRQSNKTFQELENESSNGLAAGGSQ